MRKLSQRASSRPHTNTQLHTHKPTTDHTASHLQHYLGERHCTDGDEEILVIYPELTMATDADIVPQVVTDFVFDLYDSVTLSQLVEEQSRFYNTVFRDLSSKVRFSPFRCWLGLGSFFCGLLCHERFFLSNKI